MCEHIDQITSTICVKHAAQRQAKYGTSSFFIFLVVSCSADRRTDAPGHRYPSVQLLTWLAGIIVFWRGGVNYERFSPYPPGISIVLSNGLAAGGLNGSSLFLHHRRNLSDIVSLSLGSDQGIDKTGQQWFRHRAAIPSTGRRYNGTDHVSDLQMSWCCFN